MPLPNDDALFLLTRHYRVKIETILGEPITISPGDTPREIVDRTRVALQALINELVCACVRGGCFHGGSDVAEWFWDAVNPSLLAGCWQSDFTFHRRRKRCNVFRLRFRMAQNNRSFSVCCSSSHFNNIFQTTRPSHHHRHQPHGHSYAPGLRERFFGGGSGGELGSSTSKTKNE